MRTWRKWIKRVLDVLLAAAGLLIFGPAMLALAVAVRLDLGSPILFRQQRPGLGGAPFCVLKFRTMREAVDRHGLPLPDAARLTRLGRFLRATSLDELPELWNVLRGDMSMVGPRPLLTVYLDRYTPEQARRHEVKPGITGWAQIHGRNALSWEEKFQFDCWYIDHWTLGLDVKILVATIGSVLRREGINATSETTMPEFCGSSQPRPAAAAHATRRPARSEHASTSP